jgi:preprotein translocase subunit SecA
MFRTVSSAMAHSRLALWRGRLVPQIKAIGAEFRDQNDQELRKRSLSLKYRARSGERISRLLPEAYALVREAARRTLDMEHFDVQLLGGIALFHRSIAEMVTGEGKTLTATLPLYLRALAGKGAHLATVNDYLARRDAEWMMPIYQLLGLSVGVVQTQMSQPQRRKAYASDITYGTAKEFGFDFLRDRLLLREAGQGAGGGPVGGFAAASRSGGDQPVQRDPFFVLVDEADSVLIDEARTPLIISAMPGETEKITACCYDWSASVVDEFVDDEDYEYDHEKKKLELTGEGRQRVRLLSKPELMNSVGLVDIYEYIERAVKVNREFQRDYHYVVREGEIIIVDESTGRLAEGRKWRAGIHQAIEAREKVKVTVPTGQAARITVQDYFLRYQHLAGMTGTALTSARELRKIYRLPVVSVPTNRPVRRTRLPNCVYGTNADKWQAVIDEIRALHAEGRPVLIGTRSIDRSELLARLLDQEGIEHQVLNAHRIAEEADIIAAAGQPNRVTVSTNMAGRGTDIKLGEAMAELGGLHVICTELHDSARIDRQLMGRCGRQGDPGSIRQYLALDDDILLAGFGPSKAERLKAVGANGRGNLKRLRRLFLRAQKRVERRNYRGRRMLLHYEKEKRKMQREMGQDPYLDTPD